MEGRGGGTWGRWSRLPSGVWRASTPGYLPTNSAEDPENIRSIFVRPDGKSVVALGNGSSGNYGTVKMWEAAVLSNGHWKPRRPWKE